MPIMKSTLFNGLEEFDAQQYEKARESFGKAAEDEPSNPVPRLFLGMTLIAMNRLPEAENEIEKGLALSPKNQLGHNLKALLLFKRNEREKAVELLSRFSISEHPRIQSLFLLEFEKILA